MGPKRTSIFQTETDQTVGCLDGQRTRTHAFQVNLHRVGALAGGIAGAGLTWSSVKIADRPRR